MLYLKNVKIKTVNIKIRHFAGCILVFVLAGVGAVEATAASPSLHTNILVILSDDQGYADAGFQGSKEIPTPNLDRLAASGVRFSSGYSAFQFCSPSRAALLTGRYPQRYGVYRNPLYDLSSHVQGLPVSETLLPEYLVKSGYKTGWVGKWHLGAAPEFTPQQRGFQETYGFLGGRHQYVNWEPDKNLEDRSPLEQKGQNIFINWYNSFYFANRKLNPGIKPPLHSTLAQGQAAAAFVREHSNEPWFLYLAFNAPHTPHDPLAERLEKFTYIANPKRRAYAAQVSLMDDAIGETLAAVQDSGQRDRTLVIYLTDNGGSAMDAGADNTPLRRGKGSIYEGGIRVPFVMSWPGHLDSGKVEERPVSALDIFATALAVADVPMPHDKPYDSVNLIPFLTGEKSGEPHEQLFWGDEDRFAIRAGKWKLVQSTNGGPDELYDLERDVGEAADRARIKPEIVAQLSSALATWRAQMHTPAYIGEDASRDHKLTKQQTSADNAP
jgi:arylsulfatase A-like enzyme